ncbi:MAG: ATPase P [Desulfovibrionaceae bacterium]|jgi:soluble P-type ATPase|nr:ATPase P [Desulfovibrionaceae bacterium]
MLALDVPGFGSLRLERLFLDFNGTLAHDGMRIPGVRERLNALAAVVDCAVLTADTNGTARHELDGICPVTLLPPGPEDEAKLAILDAAGAEGTAYVGNGANDVLALGAARLGVAVLGGEGASPTALAAADVVVTDILHALDLFLFPSRLLATLRR